MRFSCIVDLVTGSSAKSRHRMVNLGRRGAFESFESRDLLSAMSLTSYDEIAPNIYIEHTSATTSFGPISQATQSLSALEIGDGLVFNFNSAPNMQQAAIDGFEEAASLWSSVLLDDVTVNIDINFTSLDPGVLGSTLSQKTNIDYATVVNAMQDDSTTIDDSIAVSNLQLGDDIDLLLNRTSNSPNGSGSAVPYIDNDGDDNNSQLRITRANAKSLGLVDAGNAAIDASITFSSSFTWDFDPSDGIAPSAFDFVGVAAHEIGHALGFISGVDLLDVNAPPVNGPFADNQFTFVSTLDLFRYSQQSVLSGVVDWTVDSRDKFFSIDSGTSNLGDFSTGVNFGDGKQASHWKDNIDLGLMDPTIAFGEAGSISSLDLRAMDVIGWDRGFRVTSTADLLDIDLSDALPFANNGETTLRAAIQQANVLGIPTRILLPEGTYNLTLTGTEASNATVNDLDITGNVTIIGAGAGLSVISGDFTSANADTRLFEVRSGGDLALSKVTLTGGDASTGGAIWVRSGASLKLTESALTANTSSSIGGA